MDKTKKAVVVALQWLITWDHIFMALGLLVAAKHGVNAGLLTLIFWQLYKSNELAEAKPADGH